MPDKSLKAQKKDSTRQYSSAFKHELLCTLFSLTLTACAHTQSSTLQDNSGTKGNSTTEDPSARPARSSKISDDLIRILPEQMRAADSFARTKAGESLIRMMGRELTPQDVQSLVSLRTLLVAQREIREQRPVQARELAKVVLSTEHLSTQLYALAIRYLTLADIISLNATETNPSSETLARHPKSEFNELQKLQCTVACQTHGWQVIAREDPALLSTTGYRTRLLSDAVFKQENLQKPEWLRKIFLNSSANGKKEKSQETNSAKADSPLQRIIKLRSLVEDRQWNQATLYAKKILSDRKNEQGSPTKNSECPSDALFAQYTIAQATRIAQDRRSFASLQDDFVRNLDKSRCTPEAFALDKEQFESFRLDARLWLARLQWEQNKNPDAFFSARRVIQDASFSQAWEHYVDAAKVLIGRIGFEMLNTGENLTVLAALENSFSASDSEEFHVWIHSRRGLFHFLDGNFENARTSFEKVIELTEDTSTRAMAFYWIGRANHAAKKTTDGENAFLSAGMTDPLSIYDIFSGQLLARESGRASTPAKQAIYKDWQDEFNSWLQLNNQQPLKIITSMPPRPTVMTQRIEQIQLNSVSNKQFDTSLETAILFVALLRSASSDLSEGEFSQLLTNDDELISSLLKSETNQLRQTFQRLNPLHSDALPRAHQVAWLTHILGDHANSILFVGRLRESIGWDTDYLPFLYFIFYPRPFKQEFENAARTCSIDVDLLYAVSRQESLFQAGVRSPVGAVGLMQLLPTTAARVLKKFPELTQDKIDLTIPATNTIAGACYLKQLLDRYNNNLTFAIAAYNAGEAAVDNWVSKRQKIADMPYFIEFIPFAETKTYVQRVLRNYYNLKWIYQTPAKR